MPTERLPLSACEATSDRSMTGTKSYVYGPGDLPVEQINSTTGTITYLHHDQRGSIDLPYCVIAGLTRTATDLRYLSMSATSSVHTGSRIER